MRREEGTGKGKEGEWKRERLSLLTERQSEEETPASRRGRGKPASQEEAEGMRRCWKEQRD